MKDTEFKKLTHYCKGYKVFSTGNKIDINYSPDFVLTKSNDYIIYEHETEPNRKTIIADIFKAAHFLQNERTGKLIIVMNPKGKSSLISYLNHTRDYFEWLKLNSNLEEVYFVEKSKYLENGKVLKIDSPKFYRSSLKLSI